MTLGLVSERDVCAHAIAAVNTTSNARILKSGVVTSGIGVLLFAGVHALLIAPIWIQALTHAPVALIAGLTMAWAYETCFPPRARVEGVRSSAPFGIALFGALIPPTAFENICRLRDIRLDGWIELVVVLLIASAAGAATGAYLGARNLGRARPPQRWLERPEVALAAASAGMTTVMGGPIPVVNGPRAAWLFAAFLPICIAASIALALARRASFMTEASEER